MLNHTRRYVNAMAERVQGDVNVDGGGDGGGVAEITFVRPHGKSTTATGTR